MLTKKEPVHGCVYGFLCYFADSVFFRSCIIIPTAVKPVITRWEISAPDEWETISYMHQVRLFVKAQRRKIFPFLLLIIIIDIRLAAIARISYHAEKTSRLAAISETAYMPISHKGIALSFLS